MLIYGEAEEGRFAPMDEFIIITGGHCSCFDWPTTEFEAVRYTHDELERLTLANLARKSWDKAETRFWKLVAQAMGFGDGR